MARIANRPRDIAVCVGAFLEEGDLGGILSMFHPDCRVYFPPGASPGVGIDGARRAFEPFLDARPRLESDITSEVIAGDVALLGASWRLLGTDGSVLAEGQSVEVAKKLETGGWGYLIDCPNGPPPT